MALDAFDFLGLILAPRFAIPLVLAIAVGASYYFVSQRSPGKAKGHTRGTYSFRVTHVRVRVRTRATFFPLSTRRMR